MKRFIATILCLVLMVGMALPVTATAEETPTPTPTEMVTPTPEITPTPEVEVLPEITPTPETESIPEREDDAVEYVYDRIDSGNGEMGEAALIGEDLFSMGTFAVKDVKSLYLNVAQSYSEAKEILRLVNIERVKAGVAELKMDNDLLSAAMQRSAELTIFFDHTRANGNSYSTISNKVRGENIGVGYANAQAMITGWMNSSGHRSNILNPDAKTIGIGVVKVDGLFYWTQLFGTNTSVATPAYPSNRTVEAKVDTDVNAYIKPAYDFTPSGDTILIGKTKTLNYWNRNTGITNFAAYAQILPKSLTFTSTNSSVVKIDANGVFTALKNGAATISVYIKGAASTKIEIPFSTIGTWRKDSKGWWFERTDGSFPKNKWEEIGGKWYHFDKNGYMNTGWFSEGSNWYYLKPGSDGSMTTGWAQISGKWYHFANSGIMTRGWYTEKGEWYYLRGGSDGSMMTGWQQMSGKWYHFKTTGIMTRGWFKESGKWYYLRGGSDGSMATGWIKDGGHEYYLQSNGVMATNQWIGSYYVGADGKYVPGKKK